jgi:hypothetical protein
MHHRRPLDFLLARADIALELPSDAELLALRRGVADGGS